VVDECVALLAGLQNKLDFDGYIRAIDIHCFNPLHRLNICTVKHQSLNLHIYFIVRRMHGTLCCDAGLSSSIW